MNKQISRLALVALLLLASLIVATTYWQTWAAAGLAATPGQRDPARRAVPDQARADLRVRRQDGARRRTARKKAGGQTLYFRTLPDARASRRRRRLLDAGPLARRHRARGERVPDASNANLGTIFDKLTDKLKGATVTGQQPRPEHPRRRAEDRRDRAARASAARRSCSTRRRAPVYVMASSPSYDPNLIESPNGFARILHSPSACPGSSSALLNRATQGLYPPGSTFKTVTAAAALDSGDLHARLDVLRPRLLHRVRQAGLERRRPGGARAVRQRQPPAGATSTRSTRSSATSARSSARSAILDKAKDFGFYSKPPIELPSNEVARERPLRLQEAATLFDDAGAGRPGPPRVRAGQAARDAAADGARRGRRRERRHDHAAAPRQEGDVARRRHRRQGEAAGLAARDEAGDGRGAQRDDASGRRGRHGHRRADPGRQGRRQDRHRRDRAEPRLHRLVHLLRARRQPDGRGRRRRRAPAERLRRRCFRPDRQAADAGDPACRVEAVEPACV